MTDFIENIYFESSQSDDNNDSINNDDESIIDTSWIQEYDNLNKISTHQERTFMDSINAYFVYINKNLYIDKILFEKVPLDRNNDSKFSYISKELLLKIIQNKKIKTPMSKYRLIDILSYVVNLEPEIIQDFSNQNIENEIFEDLGNNSEINKFLKVLSVIDDVQLDKSIFIFHNINCLYFIFQEIENPDYKSSQHKHTIRSILKKNKENSLKSEGNGGSNNTKKVRIVTDIREHSRMLRGRHTRKKI